MNINSRTLALLGALALVPALALAQAKTPPAAPKTVAKTAAPAAAKPVATHATNGIIKSADATSLVITKTAKDTKATTFVLNSATVTKGALTPGARVEIRYRAEGSQNVATAITAKFPKPAK